MTKKIDWVGKRFGRLTVIEDLGYDSTGRNRRLKCMCDCGNEKVVQGGNLTSGNTISCGCYQKECVRKRSTTHGMSDTSLYKIWQDMKARCTNPNNISYKNYGGKGIKVCDEWLNSFEAFRDWALANGYEGGLSIERINVKGGNYCPENCCWIPKEDQVFNKEDSLICTVNGKTQDLALHVADPEINVYGLKYGTVWNRIVELGWTPEEAFSTPLGYNCPAYTINGKTQTLAQHVADPEINVYGLIYETVWQRINKYGRTPEEAFSTPRWCRRKKTDRKF